MLYPNSSEHRMELVGDVAGPEDVSGAGPEALVHEEAVLLFNRRREARHPRLDPDLLDDREVAFDAVTVRRHGRCDPVPRPRMR